MSEKLVSYETLEQLKAKAQLEGALGYAARISGLLQQKTDAEKLSQIIAKDAETFTAALSEFYKQSIESAIVVNGTFEQNEKTQ